MKTAPQEKESRQNHPANIIAVRNSAIENCERVTISCEPLRDTAQASCESLTEGWRIAPVILAGSGFVTKVLPGYLIQKAPDPRWRGTLVGSNVPHPRGLVERSGGDPRAIGTENSLS